jgi:hypothetical protein
MENPTVRATVSETPPETACWVCGFCFAILTLLMTLIPSISRAQTSQSTKPAGSEPIPEPAVATILAAFDKYEVVAMPEAHGMKDIDDFIFSLLRNPAFRKR